MASSTPAPALRDGFHRPLDGSALVVARLLAARVLVTGLPGEFAGFVVEPFPGAVAPPQVFRGGKFVQGRSAARPGRTVRFGRGTGMRRRSTRTRRARRVPPRNRWLAATRRRPGGGCPWPPPPPAEVRLVEQEVVGPASSPRAWPACPNDDPARREAVFAADLRVSVPSGAGDGRGDVVCRRSRLRSGSSCSIGS